jgi:hypothetical protein
MDSPALEMWLEMTEPVIIKCLDASTGHISYDDSVLLDIAADEDPGLPIVYKYDYGYFVYTYPSIEDDIEFAEILHSYEKRGFSKEFLNILKYARSLGCKYLQLDADGEIYNDFPMCEW